MAGYIIVDVDIKDPDSYKEYVQLTPQTIAAYDGRFVVRGGPVELLEGEWPYGRIVVLEFPTVERAKEWWSSVEYAPAKDIRQRSAITKMILVDGFKP
ncbi:DUF1330 domain-containing protein [Solitalea sp. MAHUQ-68]|uniref:DUF1330 domain-containing protein n=1 Tax=Solitalea agri TaxID=2953739 RepID=A0A9X2F2U6_9SPHI|nr:DUF1330 domain-containing protein [Solitalea agri]MCO4293190.1 DUF1330 domain-containing protein [Solitalea agri]